MARYKKVVFVSTGGTCRSILAKAVFNKFNDIQGIEAVSRGQVVLFEEPVNQKVEAVAKAKGYSLEGEKSEQLTMDDFGDDNLVLVMTDILKKKLYEDFEDAINVYSVRDYADVILREFAGEAVGLDSVYGGELPEYGELIDKTEKLIKLVIERIKEISKDI